MNKTIPLVSLRAFVRNKAMAVPDNSYDYCSKAVNALRFTSPFIKYTASASVHLLWLQNTMTSYFYNLFNHNFVIGTRSIVKTRHIAAHNMNVILGNIVNNPSWSLTH